MGDRFYRQQLEATGSCPGSTTTKRRRKVAWDDEKKQQAIDMYTEQQPTPENSMEIVAEIAEELNESPNGVRMILSKAGVYVKKDPGSRSSSKSSNGNGGGRVSKADAQNALTQAITDAGLEADEEIISKLTGKACVYLTEVITKVNS
jgi:transposase-like protein